MSLPVEAGSSELRPQTRKGDAVSAAVLYMSMSLDGFVAGPNEGPGNGLGDGGERLHDWSMTGGGADDVEAFRRWAASTAR